MSPLQAKDRRAAVETWFHENFTHRAEIGASVSVWQHGEEAFTLSSGHMNRERTTPWTDQTLVPVWSATKGPAAVTLLMAVHEAQLSLNSPLADIWPEFATAGKEGISLAMVMCHRAGLCLLDESAPFLDYAAVIRSIEQQSPVWEPDTVQAYSPRVYGFILDECVRRITGADSLGHYFHEALAKPLGLDFYIGLPESEHQRVATLFPGKYQGGTSAFQKAFTTPGSVTQRAFRSPAGLSAVQDLNLPETWAAGYVSMGGIGSARGLAQFYSTVLHQHHVIPGWVAEACSKPLSSATEDQVLHVPMSFSTGMMQDRLMPDSLQKETQLFGPHTSAFGHAGAGGSLAFADPVTGISFAYVMNQMELGVLPGPKALGMVQALYS